MNSLIVAPAEMSYVIVKDGQTFGTATFSLPDCIWYYDTPMFENGAWKDSHTQEGFTCKRAG